MENKLYWLNFDGIWFGGEALIVANSEEEAIRMLGERHASPKIRSIRVLDFSPGIKHYWDGDY